MTQGKAFIDALFLTYQESSKFILVVKNEATVDAQCGICIFAGKAISIFQRGLLRCSFNY